MSKSAIITGVASGIGLEAARDLLESGWIVYGLDVSEAALAPVTRAFASRDFHPRPCDLRDATAISTVMRRIQEETAKINAVVASAGVLANGPLANMSAAEFDRVFDVNVRGLWLTCKEAYPMLRTSAADGELARVVLLSSVSAIRPKIESGVYAASKAAVSQLTKVMAVEWATDGILVNALAPGTVDTPMIQAATADLANQGNWRPSGNSPLGRIAQAQDIVRVIRFLLSEDAGYVTGTIIPVDGGTRAAYVPNA